MVDVFPKEKRSEIMSKIRGKWTRPEREFQRRHPDAVPHPGWLPYHPNFLLGGKAVFLDSTFWHCEIPKRAYDGMGGFWREKLFGNVVRDEVASSFYEACGVLKRVPV